MFLEYRRMCPWVKYGTLLLLYILLLFGSLVNELLKVTNIAELYSKNFQYDKFFRILNIEEKKMKRTQKAS